MSTIVTRSGKGSPLTHNEVDANFTNLNTDKVEKTAADITGGTIDNTSIGATTPSTVNATTITGQTARLNGTGQNLLTFSQEFDNAVWSKQNATVTANNIAAPDGTTTADLIVCTASPESVNRSITVSSGAIVTLSFFIKKGTHNWVRLSIFNGANEIRAWFDVDTGTLGTVNTAGTGTSAAGAIQNAGGGWYRCILTGAIPSVTSYTILNASADADASFTRVIGGERYIWGAQVEFASSVGAYIPTTTTAVYGTPTLSFSGVSEIGLLSNGALYLQPAGTGALQAQATTSTTAGGNARGANAVDWQMVRNSAAQVASGTQAVIGGGTTNTSSGFVSTVAGGQANSATNNYTTIGGGNGNSASLGFSTIAGGYLNTTSGFYNFVGGGFTNSGTSGSAVTTQSGTMNGTTAVTLSGSNANIRVGQLITGTSIASFPDTYVAAISGTSLTLSRAASGSSTSTLSFFTPHGVVVGGGNNQATGSYSFIGGGGDAGTAANRNVASGDWSVVGGGRQNVASGIGSFVGGGRVNTASGEGSVVCGGGLFGTANTASGSGGFVGGGYQNVSTGFAASVLGGNNNTANGNFNNVLGGASGTTRSITANFIFPSGNPLSTSSGASQSALLVLAKQTTDATATALTSDTNAAGTTNQVILPNNSAYFFRGEVISGKTAAGDTKGWTIEGVIKRGANAASTALVGIPTVTSTYADLGAATWDIAVTADTTNGGIRVTFTGQAATTIRTVCQIRTTEMTY
jgi:hypothetical protein